MGYIVDLTVIMHRLFRQTRDISEAEVNLVLRAYVQSESQVDVHTAIRKFSGTMRLVSTDHVLDEIIRLIKKYCVDPE
jgi:hypothetical protein